MSSEAGAPVRVLFLAGSGRSGSTLLANVLGQVDGMVHVGELRYIWERGLLEDRLCGCGSRFSECSVWLAILTRAFGKAASVDPGGAIAAQQRETRVRHLPLLLWRSLIRRPRPVPPEDADRLLRLYRAVAEETGAEWVVDSSKLPTYGHMLDRIPGIELSVLHLTRDPRAAAFSWTRKKVLTDRSTPSVMQVQGVAHSSGLWLLWNTVTAFLWRRHERYVHVRYEDFAAQPGSTLDRIQNHLETPTGDGNLITDRTVELSPNHTVAGNPGRLVHGQIEIREDDEWKSSMSWNSRLAVVAIVWPGLWEFGYGAGKRQREKGAIGRPTAAG